MEYNVFTIVVPNTDFILLGTTSELDLFFVNYVLKLKE